MALALATFLVPLIMAWQAVGEIVIRRTDWRPTFMARLAVRLLCVMLAAHDLMPLASEGQKMTKSGSRYWSGVFAFLFATWWSAPAAAQTYWCPNGAGPGEVKVGEVEVGKRGSSRGVAGVPICKRGDDGSVPLDPLQQRLQSAVSLQDALRTARLDTQAKIDEMQRDPRFFAYENGAWEFFQNRQDPAPAGEYCSALFWSRHGSIMIAGPGGENRGAMMAFVSTDIPRKQDAELVPVILEQTGGKPQSVRAYHYQLPGIDAGVIAFAVPTIEAALDGMFDKADFKISMKEGDPPVFSMGWHSGLMARDRIRQCVKGRRP
jgi:hypothetical protein